MVGSRNIDETIGFLDQLQLLKFKNISEILTTFYNLFSFS